MRLCANENLPSDCIIALRDAGHDVLWIREAMPGAPDDKVLARALGEQRVLLTFDKDFGALVFRRGREASCGVVLFRIAQPTAAIVGTVVVRTLTLRNDWSGEFSVVDDRTIRMRPLKSSQGT